MRSEIHPLIASTFLLVVALAISLLVIQKTERTNREIDSAIQLSPVVATERQISEEEFFPTQDSNTDTRNWKVYTDKKYGFQFRYPNDLELRISSSYSDAGGERGITLGSKNFPVENFWMSMGVFEGYTPQELHRYLVGGAAPGGSIQTLETTLNGHQVYLGKETVGKKELGGIINYTYVISLLDRTVLWINFSGFPIDTTGKEWKYIPVGHAILHSLSFN